MSDNPFDEPAPSASPEPSAAPAAASVVPQANPFEEPKAPDMSGMKKFVQANLKDYKESQNEKTQTDQSTPPPPGQTNPKVASGFFDAFMAGLQMSTAGLALRGKMPDTVVPENAGMAMNIVSHAGTMAGDIPAMIAGGVFGTAAGAAAASPALVVPGAGEVADIGAAGYGGAAGAFAVPAALRQYYIDQIQKGSVKDFGDLWERTAATAWEAAKGAVTGVAMAGAGGIAAGALAKTAAPAIVQGGGTLAAELGAMTTVGKGLENQVPKPSDFLEGALLIGAFHGVAHVSEMPTAAKNLQEKLQNIYAATGMKPAEVGLQAVSDPILKQELLSNDSNVPKTLNPFVEEPGPNSEHLGIEKSQMMSVDVPHTLSEPAAGLSSDFPDENKVSVQVPKEEKTSQISDEERAKDPDKAAILDRVGEEAGKSKLSWSGIYTGALDSLNPIKQVVKEITGDQKLSVVDDPYALKRLAGASSGKAEVFIDHGPRDFETGKATGSPGLKEILAPHKGDLDGLEAYMIGRRSIDLEERGIETGVPQEEAKNYVDTNASKYEDTFQKIVNFRNETMAYLRDAGVISKDAYDKINETNPNAIPFMRVVDGKNVSTGQRSLRPIKSIEGSDAQIVSPIKSIIQETFSRLQIADNNRAANALVDLSQSSEIGRELVKKVPTPVKPIEVQPSEISKFLGQYGMETGGDPETFAIFRKMVGPLKSDEIAVMRDGTREVYNVGEDVAKVFNKTNEPPNVVLKALSIPAKMIRTGAVETADFLARHMIRDNTNAFVLSNNGYVPVFDALRGLKSWFTEDSHYQEWLSGGGGMSGLGDLDRKYIQPKIFELSKETGLIDKTLNVVKNPLQIFRVMAEAVTSSPRIGEYIRAKESGKDVYQSAYEARSVTIDNQRMGSDRAVRAMSLINAFWNTRIQGVDRLVQAFKENPERTAAKMALSVTLPSMLLWSVNHDDPRYKDLPDWQKDLFWIVMTKDNIYRIPKPFEGGILFGSSVERMLDSFYAHNPDAFHGFNRALFEGAVPSMIPTALKPVLEQFANRSTLTGGNIIPHALEGLAPEFQYTPYSSETAKALGKIIGYVGGSAVHEPGSKLPSLAAPVVLDNYIRSWGGGMGQYVTQILDKGLEKSHIVPTPPTKPDATLADIPFIKAFVVRYPGANAQSIQNFYENLNKYKEAMKDFKHIQDSGDPKAMQDFRASPEAQLQGANLTELGKILGEQNARIRNITKDPNMSGNDKRQLVDGIYSRMIEAAKQGNERVKKLQERVKNQ